MEALRSTMMQLFCRLLKLAGRTDLTSSAGLRNTEISHVLAADDERVSK